MHPDQHLCLAYARAADRPTLTALFRFDTMVGETVSTAREPGLTQLRLAWWRDVLNGKGQTADPDVLILQAALGQDHMALLIPLIDGWEVLLDGEADDALASHGRLRGAALFATALALKGEAPSPASDRAGACWAVLSAAGVAHGAAIALPFANAHDARFLARQSLPLAILARISANDAQRGRMAGPLRRIGSAFHLAIARR